jgi:hypothetical protein
LQETCIANDDPAAKGDWLESLIASVAVRSVVGTNLLAEILAVEIVIRVAGAGHRRREQDG